jgi:hypothetical protein
MLRVVSGPCTGAHLKHVLAIGKDGEEIHMPEGEGVELVRDLGDMEGELSANAL